jgi:hypothetical protein
MKEATHSINFTDLIVDRDYAVFQKGVAIKSGVLMNTISIPMLRFMGTRNEIIYKDKSQKIKISLVDDVKAIEEDSTSVRILYNDILIIFYK